MKRFILILTMIAVAFVNWCQVYKEDCSILYLVAPTLKRGVSGTATVTTARIVLDMSDPEDLEPNSAALLLLLNKITGRRVVHNSEFDWQEDDYVPMHSTVSGAQDCSGAATKDDLLVVDADPFRVGDLITFPAESNQVCVVDAVDTTNNHIDITSLDGAVLGSYAADIYVEIIGNWNEEGSGKRTILSTQPTIPENYTQIIKSDTGETGTLSQTKVYGPEELARNRKKLKVEHDQKIQRAMLFGELKKDTTGTHPKRAMKGIENFVITNVTDVLDAVLTESAWEAWLETLFQYGSDVKYVFCSARVISYLSAWARNKLQTVSKDTTYGINITQYLSPHGKVFLLNARKIFNHAPWTTYAIGLDLVNIRYVVLGNRDTKLKLNVQANDEDQEIDEYLTECSVEVKFEETCAIMKNVG